MEKAIEMLSEVKESIINAYEIKTGLSRTKLSHLMDEETWMNANKAIELGFADDILTDEKLNAEIPAYAFSGKAVQMALVNKLTAKVSHMLCMTASKAQYTNSSYTLNTAETSSCIRISDRTLYWCIDPDISAFTDGEQFTVIAVWL